MNIDQLFGLIPIWLKTSLSILTVLAILGWRLFSHVIKIRRAIDKLKEESYNEVIVMYKEIQEENKRLRGELKNIKDGN